VPAGDAVLVLSRHGAWKKYRCVACAGWPAPEALDTPIDGPGDDLATRVERMRREAWARLAALRREPGEEG
jgi:hypothetical protein